MSKTKKAKAKRTPAPKKPAKAAAIVEATVDWPVRPPEPGRDAPLTAEDTVGHVAAFAVLANEPAAVEMLGLDGDNAVNGDDKTPLEMLENMAWFAVWTMLGDGLPEKVFFEAYAQMARAYKAELVKREKPATQKKVG